MSMCKVQSPKPSFFQIMKMKMKMKLKEKPGRTFFFFRLLIERIAHVTCHVVVRVDNLGSFDMVNTDINVDIAQTSMPTAVSQPVVASAAAVAPPETNKSAFDRLRAAIQKKRQIDARLVGVLMVSKDVQDSDT